ncbi:P-selectin glycoprotein ligand 1 [Hippoglossus hippoglossus]|uniref:P-selectin glycoprotein ligand 1 n=1 Tax=Hippoglossus hippoglossus TaxID=8267 RepID=UPI00148B37FA|nr:P-selectin glycoprotein ligand 1 [Hippoglossus hippoglossus]XP_034459020.1 P-selectin glycoprotein ligand 1 [Hippoglossus hippoglossus]XP_034459021.1 P-selectin glycoprotein ligand 1 [Hippoglossus hippoglossus]
MRLSAKACLRLLCGISVLFSVEGENTSITETSSKAATAAPNTANMLLTSAHNESETQAATWNRSATHNPAEVMATAHTSVSHTAETEEADASSSNSSTAGLDVVTTAAAARSSGPPMLHTPTAVTAAQPTGDAQPPPNTTISETVKPTEDETQRRSSTTSTDMTSPETTSATSLRLTSTTKPEVTSRLSPSTTSQTTHTISSASSSTVTVTNPATEVSDPTSLPVTTTKTLTSSSSEISASSHSPTESPTDGSSISTSVVSTSPARIFPKRLPIPSTTPTTAKTAAPCKVSKVPPSTSEVQPCSTRGAMSHCLIAIASLAVLACIFIVSTVILCTKLSSRRYKVRRPKESTEMMCISTLLPEEDFTYTRHRTPIANGVLVFPAGRDSDEEGGDNVTLSSFLPENDRYV